MNPIEIKGTKIQHYKGGKYTVLGLVTHSETLEEMLAYQNDRDKKIWVRPVNMFYEEVEYKGEWVPRFKIIKNDNTVKIKRGDRVGEAFSGIDGIIADIQYSHDRYQFKHISGWRYGIGNIALLDEEGETP